MKQFISISTTTRMPYRIADQLPIFKKYFNNKIWPEFFEEIVPRLIQHDLYHPKGIEIEYPIKLEKAKDIFKSAIKKSERGRRNRNNFGVNLKLGFFSRSPNTTTSGKVKITPLGEELILKNANVQEVFLRSLLKYGFPNPLTKPSQFKSEDGYNIIPLIGALRLITSVNFYNKQNGMKESGISRLEFNLFVPSLINISKVNLQARELIRFRTKYNSFENNQSKKNEFEIKYRKKLLKKFLNEEPEWDTKTKKWKKDNLNDYGHNIKRYFMYTGLIVDNNWYININKVRKIEVKKLLDVFDGSQKIFQRSNTDDYFNYIGDKKLPSLPFKIKEVDNDKLKKQNIFQSLKQEYVKRGIEEIDDLINNNQKYGNGLDLERFGLRLLYIFGNTKNIVSSASSFDDEGFPLRTAPGVKFPDAYSVYNNFNLGLELTEDKSRAQDQRESVPIARHFEYLHDVSKKKNNYGIFLAPFIHQDVYERLYSWTRKDLPNFHGKIINFIPLNYKQIKSILIKILEYKKNKIKFKEANLEFLLSEMSDQANKTNNSIEWEILIDKVIQKL